MRTTKAAASPTASTTNIRQLSPPRNRIAIAMVVTTTSAPKSGSRSSSPATKNITAEHGQEPLLQVVHERGLAHRVVGRVEHDQQLHDLRGLEGRGASEIQRRAPFTSRPIPG